MRYIKLKFIGKKNINQESYPVIQAKDQHKVWNKILGTVTPTKIAQAIGELKEEDQQITPDGEPS